MALSKIEVSSMADNTIHGRRNLVINSAMQVAQRNTTQASIGGNTNYWTVDRYKLYAPNTAGRLTMSQDTDTPDGFGNSIKFDCTTADTSIAANEYMLLEQSFEGQDLQQFKKGTSNAEQITVSFYMKTNKAFTFMCELNDFDNNRVNTQRFTTSTSWTRHILTFAADTTGALDDNTDRSFGLGIWMHGGSNFTGGTYVSNTWQSRSASDNMRAVGIGSFFDSTDNLVRITGIQLEVGSQATPFEHRSFGEELQLCQRYYERYETSGGNYARFGIFQCTGTTSAFGAIDYKVSKRTAAVTLDTVLTRLALSDDNNAMLAVTGIAIDSNCNSFENTSLSIVASGGGLVAGECTQLLSENISNGYIAIDAEL